AQQEGQSEPVTTETVSVEAAQEDPKKAAVAAAIARAKARKAQQQASSDTLTTEPASVEAAEEDPKKAAVAAAIARAKARKAQQEQNNKFEENE
ncbi:electron transport complex subunit RsxC, partial [Vibrio sp. T11.5]|nr:electron transport complex subunit RsxC [Vibrio sp. T11.5]